ncbi:translesion DNA synthesis-associated protein ImuA [Wenzhouxiangella marina]|uniref:translesion DNA synthesis-associated protein ImuA n=1 Tax=Wenzhouxiangella marina TaxID=1579979 RepID=UPI0006736C81|nr:translesion DNA synthesis-associated protein ImuA [Wenzhouxiangella marina]
MSSRSDLWRGQRRPVDARISSGRADLDAWLPAGGWPSGRLIEFQPDHFGLGELELLLPMMAQQTRQGQPIILAAPPMIPCPQRLARSGVALDKLVVVRRPEQAFWAAEQSLKSGLCGMVMVWPPRGRVQPRALRRLQLSAEQGAAPAFICYRPGQQPPPSLATLRLAIHPGPELELLRGAPEPGRRFQIGRSNVVSLRLRTRQPLRARAGIASPMNQLQQAQT